MVRQRMTGGSEWNSSREQRWSLSSGYPIPWTSTRRLLARRNAETLQERLRAEWNDKIDATMATIHTDEPFQRIPALDVDVVGCDAVRSYDLARFASWPGPAFFMRQVAITEQFGRS